MVKLIGASPYASAGKASDHIRQTKHAVPKQKVVRLIRSYQSGICINEREADIIGTTITT